MSRLRFPVLMGSLLVGLLPGCGDPTGGTPATLAAVTPAPEATAIPVQASLTFTFGQPMEPGMMQLVDLHQGTVAEPTVPLDCGWNPGRTALTCMPRDSLTHGTHYTMHLGAGMTDAGGHHMDLSTWSMQGGQWATAAMMGGMHAGSPAGMMGPGWKDGAGHYGMLFGFTTE